MKDKILDFVLKWGMQAYLVVFAVWCVTRQEGGEWYWLGTSLTCFCREFDMDIRIMYLEVARERENMNYINKEKV